jgi:chromosome segregation ATPase
MLQTNLQSECSQLKVQVQQLNALVTEKAEALSNSLSDGTRTAAALKQAHQDLQLCRDSNADLQYKMSNMRREIALAHEAVSVATAKYDKMKAHVDVEYEDINRHDSRLAEEQRVVREAQDNVSGLQRQLEELKQKVQDSQRRASDSCTAASVARDEVVKLQQALQDAEKRAHDSDASASEARRSASAASADLNELQRVLTELAPGWLHKDHQGGQVSGEDLNDLRRELQSLQYVPATTVQVVFSWFVTR